MPDMFCSRMMTDLFLTLEEDADLKTSFWVVLWGYFVWDLLALAFLWSSRFGSFVGFLHDFGDRQKHIEIIFMVYWYVLLWQWSRLHNILYLPVWRNALFWTWTFNFALTSRWRHIYFTGVPIAYQLEFDTTNLQVVCSNIAPTSGCLIFSSRESGHWSCCPKCDQGWS